MEIIMPYARVIRPYNFKLTDGITLLQDIEWCGRISHRSEDSVTETSWERFIRSVVLGHGDWSIVEHAHATVDAIIDRGITHEWVRHRIGAYTQESTCFVNYAKKNTTTQEYVNPAKFICPPSILATNQLPRKASIYPMNDQANPYDVWFAGRIRDEEEYMFYIANGIKPQEARTCFPNALASRLVATYNLRMWRHFFLMRTTREAHPQMREVTIPLLADFQRCIPVLYEDIEPEAKQSENLKKMR